MRERAIIPGAWESGPSARNELAFITADIAPVGGVIKQRPGDFLVEELPLYEPSGEGEHLYLFVEKQELSTQQMVSILADHFGVERRAIGYAGMKDKMAVTRQVVSIHLPGRSEHDFPAITHNRVKVLWADRHANKLRLGHLRGNRFSVRVRETGISRLPAAKRALDRLAVLGVPNYLGVQRFGVLRNNHRIGRAMVLGDYDAAVRELLGPSEQFPGLNAEARALFARGDYAGARALYHHSARAERNVLTGLSRGATAAKAFFRLDPTLRGFFLSAFQSAVFNAALAGRVADGTVGKLLPGDVAIKHVNGAPFSVDEAVAADPQTADRLARFEIGPSGPLWGVKMRRASGRVDEAEIAALNGAGVSLEQLERADPSVRDLMGGARRLLRVPVIDPEVEGGVDEHGTYIRCAFELPKGSFATVVMNEVMKTPAAQPGGDADEEEE